MSDQVRESGEFREILRQQVDRLLADAVDRELLLAAESGTWPEALWAAVTEAGLPLTLVPEEKGGSGGGFADAEAVLRAAGRHQAPVPLAENLLAARLLADAGIDLPEGPLTLAPVRPGDRLELEGSRLTGTAGRVPWGKRCGHVVCLAAADDDWRVALVKPTEVRIEANANLAGEPRDTLAFDRAPVVASAPSEVDGAALLRLGAFARAAQMAGALEFALAEAVRYASERVQFGRPIGKFQAIQQQMAGLAIEVAAAGAAAEVAAAALDRGDGTFEVAAAKVRVGEAAGRVAAIAHQVHGAIGFTQEHSLHFATRRLWAWRSEFGGIAHWAEAIGRQAAARGADRLWPYLASR